MEVLVINGRDYSGYIESKGAAWSRNDLDSDKTTRLKNGRMRRDKIGTKRKISYKLMHMSRDALATLDDDLSAPTFSARYLDLHGEQTREFYCSSFEATLASVQGERDTWGEASFSMIEV